MASFSTRRFVSSAIKLIVSLAIIAYLIHQAVSAGTFDAVWHRPKNWVALAAAFGLGLSGVLLAATRWWILVRCLGFALRLRDAIRLGMMGYVLNYTSLSIAGEDLFKGFFLAREHGKGRRTEAFATVLVDRVIGVFSLFFVAAVGVVAAGSYRTGTDPMVAYLSRAALVAFAIGTAIIAALLTPALTNVRTAELMGMAPVIGRVLRNLVSSLINFRGQPLAILAATILSVGMQLMYVGLFYLIGSGLGLDHPTPRAYLLIVPLSLTVAMLSLSLGALGIRPGI